MSFNPREQYYLCVKCGKCKSVCPVFDELTEEGASPRGRITLIQALFENTLEPSKRAKMFISKCLLCGACTEICPNDVQTDLLVISARQKFAEKPGLDFTEISLTKIGFSKTTVSFKLAKVAEKAVGSKIRSDSGIFYRVPVNRIIPEIKNGSFSGSEKNIWKNKTKTGFFLGCLIDFIYHDVAGDAIKIMNTAGITPYIPRHQKCCGLPALSLGDRKNAVEQARAVITLFADADAVIVACASCGSMLKNYYPILFDDPSDKQKAVAFVKKVKDITEIIPASLISNVRNNPLNVTYHDPCHLKRGMAISEYPRLLIKKAGYKLVEMKKPDRCCGLGGAFNIKFFSLSSAITQKKTEDIKQTGASIVATGCPGCMANIAGALIERGLNVKVVHTVNLLASAIRP